MNDIVDEDIVAGACESLANKELVRAILEDGMVVLELETEFEQIEIIVLDVETVKIPVPKQGLKGVSSKVKMKPKKKNLSTNKRGPNKKTLLAMAALTCRKVTSWTGMMVDTATKARQEAAKLKSSQWSAKNICGGLVKELVDTVAARSVTGNIMELVVNRTWWEIKCRTAWDWLEGDKALQNTMISRIQREEEESRLLLEEQKRLKRLANKEEKEQIWSQKRKEKRLTGAACLEESGMEQMTELLRCMTLMQEMEYAGGLWMTWSNRPTTHEVGQHLLEDMNTNTEKDDRIQEDVVMTDQGGEVVEMEVVEHAHLDFLTLELGLDEVHMECGEKFLGNEELIAHEEMDRLLSSLQDVEQSAEQAGVNEDRVGVSEDRDGDGIDKEAYFGAGSWWMDRWIPAKTGNVSLGPAGIVGNYNDISCSGHLKRKSRTRSGCWWPGAGSTASTRRPWQTTSGARSRLSKMKLRFEIINNQARIGQEIQILNDKSQCLFMPRAKESLVLGAGGARSSSRQEEDLVEVNSINNILGDINYTPMLEPGSSREAVKDTPGKDIGLHFMNIILPGPKDAEGAGQVHEGDQGRGHGGQEVCDGLPEKEVQGQDTQSGPGGEVHEGVPGGSRDGHEVGEEVPWDGVGGPGEQPDCGGGGADLRDGVQEEGGSQHLWLGQAVARVASSIKLKLSSPKDSESPGWVKSRRRRVPDGLVQKRLKYFAALSNCSSENLVPSGGASRKSEIGRGIKRGMGDQMEGPSGLTKKVRKD